MMKANRPSEFELQVLGVLWEFPNSTVREVRDRLPDGKDRAYTSVLSVMQVMLKKGFLKKQKAETGGGDKWCAIVQRDEVSRPILKRLVEQVFAGKPSLALQHLLDAENLEPDEVARIREMVESLDPGESEGSQKP